ADHGNAEQMIDFSTGKPMTAHTINEVPFIYVSKDATKLRDGGILADIAPTMLKVMNLEIPSEITGKSLIK
ncbi:MAG TPA: 2,3-bisphosphoglycerate-independent phosphoglycerate mutase, partial [Clostridium sp.]|nr:2,3-bisphosphoglycerate-independent phosphoglycerate mutase [Clostridium sp.]